MVQTRMCTALHSLCRCTRHPGGCNHTSLCWVLHLCADRPGSPLLRAFLVRHVRNTCGTSCTIARRAVAADALPAACCADLADMETEIAFGWPWCGGIWRAVLRSKRKERSLDVICLNHGDFEMWYWGIQVSE